MDRSEAIRLTREITVRVGNLRLMLLTSGPSENEAPEPEPIEAKPPIQPPPARKPYFDVGDATGAPGETVEVIVEAGCLFPITGFHIGGGVGITSEPRSGYGKFRAVGVKLGPFLSRYLKAKDDKLHASPDEVGDHYFSRFQFMDWSTNAALPEEWWEFLVGFFSLEHQATLGATHIPVGTNLFTVMIDIHASTRPGKYELTCKDEWYYLNSRIRRRDFTYTDANQGITKVETFGGVLTVK